jgi:hypothetical protein
MNACRGASAPGLFAAPATGAIRLGLAALVLVAAAMPPGAQAQQWRIASHKAGIRLESRSLPGERFDELRASTRVAVAPPVVADFLVGDYLDQKNGNIRRTFNTRSADRVVWSDVLTAPAIAPRCYSMQFERSPAAADGRITVRFSTGDYIGASPEPDCITLRARGQWTLAPEGEATRITYTSLTDIGGGTPAMLVRGTLSSAAVSSVRKVADGALELHARRGGGE